MNNHEISLLRTCLERPGKRGRKGHKTLQIVGYMGITAIAAVSLQG